ncbi:transposase [Phyllobacterium sp. TAF24]|uniref:IS110 family transposase n=1 Tax=Phyllobacterium sp. TAF24 TaxID=3233068 RepID=UPI003F99E844
MTQFDRFVGIDVSKDHLDIHCLPDGLELRVANSPEGIGLLLQRIGSVEGVAFGCEATGGYEACLLVAANEAGLLVWCLHPQDIRGFARLKGKRAKTDRLDARAIAEVLVMAVVHRMPVVRTRQQSSIKELTTLRRCLISMNNELKSLQARMTSPEAQAAIAALIAAQVKVRKQLEAAIASGRPHIRRILYMACLSIIRAKSQPLARFYQKLRAAGKPFKVAIVAIMRKLIVIINAIIKTDTPWRLEHQI